MGTVPETTTFALWVMLCLELKHFVADYLLQYEWMIRGKGSLRMPGGYAHAGIHAAGSVIILIFLGLAPAVIAAFALAEFVVHYALDFSKAHYGDHVSASERPRAFWAFNGLDQFLHHTTYIIMTYLIVLQTI
jgi:hypothetical protein